MFRNFKFYEADDGGADGAPPVPEKKESTADVVKAAVESVAAEFRKTLTASKPEPVVVPSAGVDIEALKREAVEVNTKVDELFAEGKAAEAMRIRDEFFAKVNRQAQGDPAANPLVQAAFKHGVRSAKAAYPELYKAYGSEMESYVKSLPVERQVDPDAWDEAAERVRARHFDDLMAAERTKIEDDVKSKWNVPPVPGGSRGSSTVAGVKLDDDQQLAIEMLNVKPEAYAAEVKRAEEYDKLPVRQRGRFDGYPVMDNSPVVPGRF